MKRKHWKVSVFDKTSETIKDDTFYTSDTEAYLVFELIDDGFTPDTASLTVYNVNGKVTIHVNVKVVGGVVRYEIPEEAIGHGGVWRTQVIFTKNGEDYTTSIIEFEVSGHLLDKKKPKVVAITNWNHFIKHVGGLVDAWEHLEEIRQVHEQQRELAESKRQNEFRTNETRRQSNELVREESESVRVANEVERLSKDSERDSKIENLAEQFQDVLDETTGKDVISAPEIILARGEYDNLSQRLLSTDQQLQHTASVIINVEDFKDLAVGDDYTESFKAAANSVTNGATIVFPKNKQITLKTSIPIKSNTVIDFSNAQVQVSGNFRPISITGTISQPIKNVHVKNLNITLNGSGTSQSAIYFSYAEDCSYENIVIDNPGLNGIEVMNSKRVHGKKIKVITPQFFGILYYLSDDCSDEKMYVYRPKYWAHQFKSSFNCKSIDIVVFEPQNEYGLYMWSGHTDGFNAPRANEYCGYIRPRVKGSATCKHLIYINASPNCYVENPVLEQVSGGWTPIAVSGTNTVEDGLGGTFTTDSSGFRLINPKIKCVGNTQAVLISGKTDKTLIDFVIDGGIITGAGDMPIYTSYAKGEIRSTVLKNNPSNNFVFRNSEVNLVNIESIDSGGAGVSLQNSSIVKCVNCKVLRSTGVGFSVDATSRLVWIGGEVDSALSGSGVISGNDCYVGSGAIFKNGLLNGNFNSDIRVSGKRNVINSFFDKGSSAKMNYYIQETTGASDNVYGYDTVFISPLDTNVLLLDGSNSKNYTSQ